LTIAVIFTPTQIVHAESTTPQIEDVTIEWIINEPINKKAVVHVITSEGNYDFLVEGSLEQVGEEWNVSLDAYLLLEDNTQIYAQSATASAFDIIYGAPYASPSTGVETIKIHLGPVEATVLAIASAIVIAVMFYSIILTILEAVVLLTLLDSLQWAILLASIPWVYLTIFSADHNSDWSLTLYLPWDENILPMLQEGMLYIATAFSWWLIEPITIDFILFQFTYFVATWVQPLLGMPSTPPQPPSTSFAWSPDIIYPGQEVTYVSTSFDPDGEIQSWHWWFGDGSEADGESITHAYSEPGSYNVRLEVTDNDSLVGETSTSLMGIPLNVIPEAPLGAISLIVAMIGALGLFVMIHHPRKARAEG